MTPKDVAGVAEMFPGDVPCVKHWEKTHELVQRIAVIEERVSDIRDIKSSIGKIEQYIASHSQRLPQAEQAILQLTREFNNTDHRLTGIGIAMEGSKTKQNIMAAVMGALGGAAIVAVVQQVVSHLVGG